MTPFSIIKRSQAFCVFICAWFLLSFTGFIFAANAQFPTAFSKQDYEEIRSDFNRPDSVFFQLKEKYNEAKKVDNQTLAASYLQQMGQVLYFSGHYPQALDYLLQAGKIFRNANQQKLLAENLTALGEVYYRSKQKAMARKQYDEALVHYNHLELESGKADVYGRLGHLYEKSQQYDSAFYFQRKALTIFQRENTPEKVAKIFENIGSIYEDQQKYDSAYANFNKAYQLNKKLGHDRAQVEVLNNLGDVLRKTGKFRDGLNYSFKTVKMAEKVGDRYQFSGAYNDIAKAYNFLNKNDSAFYYLNISRDLQSDIYSEESNKQLALLQTFYDTDKKDRAIEKLTQAHKTDLLLAISVGAGIVFVILIAGLIISRQRLKMRNDQKLHEQNRLVFQTASQLMEVELKNKKLEEENLRQQLELKTKELSNYTLHVIRKNQLLDDLHSKLEALVKDEKRDQKKQIKQLSDQISTSLTDDNHWDEFRGIFEQVHQSFFERLQLQCDTLTSNDLRLIALIKMNLTTTDIATLLGISQDSLRVLRYRLRKKLNIAQGDNLSSYIQSI